MTAALATAPAKRWAEDWATEALVVVVHHRTDHALLASADGVHANAFWFPTSLVLVDEIRSPSVWAITIPRWLAKDRGLAKQPETA